MKQLKRLAGKNKKLIFLVVCLAMVAIITNRGSHSTVQAQEFSYRVYLPSITRDISMSVAEPPFVNPVPTSTPSVSPSPTATPVATSTPAAPPTAIPTPMSLGSGSRFGVWSGSGSEGQTTRLQESGTKYTRIMVFWSEIERNYTEPATYDFAQYDSIFGRLNQAGITAIAEIRWNPTWAATTLCGPIDKQGGMAAFDRFVKALVQRYKAAPYNVKNWEFYNEPDGVQTSGQQSEYCACFGNYPNEYVNLLRTGHAAVKSFDPTAKVLVGGLAFQDVPGTFNVDFLDRIMAAGAAQYFDVMNVHYYSNQEGSWSGYGKDIEGKVNAVKQIMGRYGVNKPIAVTEVGWTSSDPRAADFNEKQARYVPKVLARSLALNLYAIIWFSVQDWNGADLPYGLTDVNLNPKPAFVAFQTAATKFGSATSVRRLLPAELGSQGAIEGYAFSSGGQERWVVWADASPVQIAVPGRAQGANDKMGQAITLRGNGLQTPLVLDDSPIYVVF